MGIHHDRFSAEWRIDRNKYGYHDKVKSTKEDAAGEFISAGFKKQVYEMYGEYLENLRKPYPEDLLDQARNRK